MTIDRRSFLKLLLATAAAEAVDFDKLLWVPKPVVTVRAALPGTYGATTRSTETFWRNQLDYAHLPKVLPTFDSLIFRNLTEK